MAAVNDTIVRVAQSHPHRLLPVLFASLTLLAISPPVTAQVTAAISGRIEDASGTGVRGVTVILKNLETGATRTVTTGDAGDFRVLSLPVGPYQVRAERAGFKTEVRNGVNLVVGQEAVVRMRLEIGDLAQEVTVSEEVPVVNTTTASVSGLVGEREIKDLPLNGRSFDNLMTLNPGVINYSLKSANTSTSNGNTFSVDGRRPMDNLVLLNGIEYTGSSQLAITPGGVSGYLLGIDAVREFNVETDTYGAEYGKRSGAQVSVITQSGTNALHGTLFEFLRNSAVDSRSFFAQTSFTPPFRQNQFGGALGGPLKKNRLFLFGNYEGFRQAETQSSVSVVPDAKVRQGTFPNSSGTYLPVANLNPAMLPYFSFWPQANGPELLVNGLPSGTAFSYTNPNQHIREDFGTARLDYTLGNRNSISASYTIDDGNSLIPLADPLFGSYSTLRMQVASVQDTMIFSPNFLATARAGFSRAGFNLDSSLAAQFPSDLSFVEGAGPGGIVVNGGVTTTGLSGITSAGPNNAAGVWNRRNLYTYSYDVAISKGRHQISAGVWTQWLQDNEDSASRQLGQATFTSLTTFLQGTVSTFQVVPTANELGWRSFFGAWYFQDTIKLRPNLTLRAGIRQESTDGWNEVFGRAANYIPDANGILETAPRVAGSVFTQNRAKWLFGPRVGLAWDPTGHGKMSIRAGFGTYYSLIDDLAFLLNSLPPYNGSISDSGSLSSIVPIVPNAPVPPSCGPGVPTPCTTYAPQGVQADAQTATVQEWSLSVERELTPTTVLRVAYVGSFGYHGLLSVDPNTIPATVCTTAGGCQAGGVATSGSPATAANQSHVPQGAQYIPVGTRPNPYLGAGFFWYTEGNSSYNALETDVFHHLSRGFEIRANYTWSKNLDMNSGLTGAQSSNQSQMVLDRNDVGRDWGPSALNAASQASISARYELPFGPGKQWLKSGGVESKVLGGWQLNAITTLLSGFPFTPVIGSNRSGDGDTRNPDRPSLNPAFSGPVVLGQPGQWFNPNAFVLPAAGTYGNLGRGVFSGPGLADLDFSLFKTTALSERAGLQFRAEFFNILNHPNFGTPNATVFSSGAINASAGLITTLATTPRQIQFGLKLIF
ncbi:MAG TPA: carboxypeptidase regulatory-like domain-containing protein [Bryobacteraceae bacterium]|nr:carboxypeptidase regulatory-like domain-containing protein [Bryobacteraceae bacterium]